MSLLLERLRRLIGVPLKVLLRALFGPDDETRPNIPLLRRPNTQNTIPMPQQPEFGSEEEEQQQEAAARSGVVFYFVMVIMHRQQFGPVEIDFTNSESR
jgi:hypothetical protein